ncbi:MULTISPECIES: LysE family translocator [Rhodomicrobium]|uniref:LysE family translocator n=1 Tax=Rhodomicrobium TaxID=1068 RepID=UPI001483A3C7|nr:MULTISPECIES: LysE family translocator [Rhodomicrobium]
MSWHDLLGFILILAAAAAIPGPDIAAIVATGIGQGLGRAFRVVFGLILGHAVWMTAAATGLAALALALGAAFILIKIGAVAYLLYLAWSLWTAPVTEASAEEAPAPSGRAGIVTGLLVSLSNPKALVFFSAVVPSILPIQNLSLPDFALVIAASSLTFIVVFGAWALLAAKARAFLGRTANRRAINRGSALLIAGSAVAVASR